MSFGKNSFEAFYIFPVVTRSPGLDRKSRIIGFWVATLFYIIHLKWRQCRYNSHVKYFHLIFQLNMSTIYSKDHQSLIHLIPYYTDQCASPMSGHTEQGNCSCRSGHSCHKPSFLFWDNYRLNCSHFCPYCRHQTFLQIYSVNLQYSFHTTFLCKLPLLEYICTCCNHLETRKIHSTCAFYLYHLYIPQYHHPLPPRLWLLGFSPFQVLGVRNKDKSLRKEHWRCYSLPYNCSSKLFHLLHKPVSPKIREGIYKLQMIARIVPQKEESTSISFDPLRKTNDAVSMFEYLYKYHFTHVL